jgi:type IV fimbrial biogenesis protein FimT
MLKTFPLQPEAGFTLIEVMIVIVIAAVLLALAVPAFQDTIDKNRLKAVSEVLYGDFQFAQSEAIKRNQPLIVDFTISNGGATWCYGFRLGSLATCDCTLTTASAANACVIDNVLKVVRSTDYFGVSMTNLADPIFDNVRGTVSPTTTVTLNSQKGKETRVAVTTLGRVVICSPAGTNNIPGYSTSCP